MKKSLLAILCLFACSCATKRATVTAPFPKPATAQQKGFNEGYLAAEKSYAANLVEELRAHGFTDAGNAYQYCIETIVRVGNLNAEYRQKLEALGK